MFASPSDTVPIDVDADPPAADTKGKGKAVSWAPDVKVESSVKAEDTDGKQKETQALDGTVGQMEIYKSGAIKMRLGKNVVMDVSFSFSRVGRWTCVAQKYIRLSLLHNQHFFNKPFTLT